MNKRPMFTSSFDGSASSKRVVSMSGRRREDSKVDLLAKAKAERAQREIERKREGSAREIQRFWRGDGLPSLEHAASHEFGILRYTSCINNLSISPCPP